MLVVTESISDPNYFVNTICEAVHRCIRWSVPKLLLDDKSLGGTHVGESSYMVAVVAVLGADHCARFRFDEWITPVRVYS
jgi:hypothetical protein